MNENVCYSNIPALNEFITPEDGNDSHMQVLSRALLKEQMNLSRIIMYGEENAATIDERYIPFIRSTMSLIADIYDVFEGMECQRLKYSEAIHSLKE